MLAAAAKLCTYYRPVQNQLPAAAVQIRHHLRSEPSHAQGVDAV